MSMNLLRYATCCLILLLLGTTVAHAQSKPTGPERWKKAIENFEAADKNSPPPQGGVVFVGSSTFTLWKTMGEDFPGVKVINRGFGGSQLADSIYYADRIILPYKPRMVVVYAGDNDIAAGKSPERVLADFKALVEKIHAELPEARVGFVSIKPSKSRWKLIDKVRAANALVKDYTETDDRLTYIDTFSITLGADGTPRDDLFIQDKLHLSRKGYELWQEVIAPAIQ